MAIFNQAIIIQKRTLSLSVIFIVFFCFLASRLFYWQIIRGPELQTKSNKQHQMVTYLSAKRGDIFDSDGNVLAGTKNAYHLFVYKPQLNISHVELVDKLSKIIKPEKDSTSSADLPLYLSGRLALSSNWISLKHYLSPEEKQSIELLKIPGLGFEDEYLRYYPESSMSAHLLGFVGQDAAGEEQGYFGLEGYFDRQLRGKSGKVRAEKDAKGNPILIGNYQLMQSVVGKSINTTINKKIQYIVEKYLLEGIERYQATAGNVIVMESKTGKIRAMASFPNYDPEKFSEFSSQSYKNPNVADLFEPGSIFKVIVMAAALNENLVRPDTACDICDKPVVIGPYSIKTWDNTYRPGSTMADVIIHSDNTGMVFAARKLGTEKFARYLSLFGFGKKTGIELQEEVTSPLRAAKDFGDIDLATNSFGQGIAVTPIQMISAVNSLANRGVYLSPTLIEKTAPQKGQTVISSKAAEEITNIMIEAVEQGESKWAKPKNMTIAGKTGTAQIPIEGHYDPEKTIASFVGFFPARDPQYTILVTLKEPKTSTWGSETAAPLWFIIAKQLLL